MYTVGINNTWATQATSIEDVKSKGFDVQPARSAGDFQMFMDGKMMGWLFKSKIDQIAFLETKGLI